VFHFVGKRKEEEENAKKTRMEGNVSQTQPPMLKENREDAQIREGDENI
jgi:hypothetical protein